MFIDEPGPNDAARQEPASVITKDGLTLLVMGFTGKKALAFKLAYIDAFHAMAAFVVFLLVGVSSHVGHPVPRTQDSG